MAERRNLLAVVTFLFVCLNNGDNLSSKLFRFGCVVSVFYPFGEQTLQFHRRAVCRKGIVHDIDDAGTHLLACQLHAETKLAEIFEQ